MRLIVLGRNPQEADVVIMGDYVSNYHAEIIQLDNGDMYIVDKSTNGTFVDGMRLVPGKETAITRNANVMLADKKLDWGQIPPIPQQPADVVLVKSIGSHYLNDITVKGTSVSRFHATLRKWKNGKWEICDHSKNGTTINGRKIVKDNWVRIKSGDELAAAGVAFENPVKGGVWKIIGICAACAAVLCGLVLGILALTGSGKKHSDTSLQAKYERTVAIVYTTYHYEVTCGLLDLTSLPDPDSFKKGKAKSKLYDKFVITEDNSIAPFTGDNSESAIGTGFFLGKNYDIVTARHCARPWETSTLSNSNVSRLEAAENYFRNKLNKLTMMGYSSINQYISQIKVVGVVDECIIFPNRTFVDNMNAFNCHELIVSDSVDEDIAILRLRTAATPAAAGVTSVKVSDLSEKDPVNASHVYTIGFPFGLLLQDISKTELQANGAPGSVSSINPPYSFGLTAVSYKGASGSPVFDNHGHVVGMLNASITASQGFNYAIMSKHILALAQKVNIE